jgi:hypothetical protein
MANKPSIAYPSLSAGSICLCTKKLNKTNFSAWHYDMCNSLAYYNLDGFIKEHTPALKSHSDYDKKLKQVTTYICLHLGRKDSTCFVDDLDTYDPQALWDSILEYHAAKSVENTANVMEKLHNIIFVEGLCRKPSTPSAKPFN